MKIQVCDICNKEWREGESKTTPNPHQKGSIVVYTNGFVEIRCPNCVFNIMDYKGNDVKEWHPNLCLTGDVPCTADFVDFVEWYFHRNDKDYIERMKKEKEIREKQFKKDLEEVFRKIAVEEIDR